METNLELAPLVARWRGPLVGLFASWGAPWEEAARLAQDSLAEAYRERTPDGGAEFGPLLRAVALERWRLAARARRRAPAGEGAPGAPKGGAATRLEELRVALEGLPAPLAEVARMHYLEHAGLAEVAALLGLPEETVRERLDQVRRELPRLLGSGAGEQTGAPPSVGLKGSGPGGGVQLEEWLLREALRPARPDPDEFLLGVEERIESEPAAAPRRAFGRSAPEGSSLFLAWLRHTPVAAAGAAPKGRAPAARPRRGMQALPTRLGLAAAFLGCAYLAPTAVLTVIASALAALSISLAWIAIYGLATSVVVGTLMGQLLLVLALLEFQVPFLHPVGDGAESEAFPALLVAGSLGCLLLAALAVRSRPWPWGWALLTDPRVSAIVAAVLGLYLVPVALERPAERASLVRFCEDFDPADLGRLGVDWTLIVGHLARDGGPLPDLGPFLARLRQHVMAGGSAPPLLLREALRIGPADDPLWQRLEEPRAFAELLGEDGPIRSLSQAVWVVALRQHGAGLDEAERAHLVQRVLATAETWPNYFGLRSARLATELLELLGAADEAAALVEPSHAQLGSGWQGRVHDRPAAAFDFGAAEAGAQPPTAFVAIEATSEAVALVARVGLPEGIELRRVRRFLEQAAREPLLPFARRGRPLVAAAALYELDALAYDSEPTPGEERQFARALLAVSVLIVLCLLATALALRPTAGSHGQPRSGRR